MTARGIRAVLSSLLPPELASRLEEHVAQLPDPVAALNHLRRLASTGALPGDAGRLRNFLTLAGFSPYLGGLLVRNPDYLNVLGSGGPARGLPTREDLEEDLARFLALRSAGSVSAALRQFKQREYPRIALADFLGTADLPALTRALSLMADVLLARAVRVARAPLEARFGRPTSRDDQGHIEEAGFVVVALGKMGGEELNYSSDIDLLYLYSRDGETSGVGTEGRGSITNREYFTRLARSVTALIAGRGPEGQVFRVDLDLRPGGRDGDLTVSVGSAVAYYRNWAEPWERQALIKARPVAGDIAVGRRFLKMVEPLVYQETPDPYLVIEIGAMKDRIDARLSAQGRSDSDIKLGWGGIRELEFAVQALQLQRGGADPWLRQGNTLLALHRLAERGLVSFAEYAALSKAYSFLRHIEHRLQLGHNRQTAVLPTDAARWRILDRCMRPEEVAPGSEPQPLAPRLEHHRRLVRAFYDSVLGRSAQLEFGEQAPDLWLDRMDDASLLERLRSSGLRKPETLLRPVKIMRRLLRPAAGSLDLRHALRRNGEFLLRAAVETINPKRALGNLEKLLSSLIADPADLLRFVARREVLGPTVHLLGRSNLLAGLLIRQPGILRHVEDRAQILRTPEAEEYRALLAGPPGEGTDARDRAGALRRRHQAALATIALRDINRQATLREVLKSLSNLADATIEAAYELARREMAERGQAPPPGLGLAVIGLGRLGYRELDYGSDLDLLFVHKSAAGASSDDLRRAGRMCETLVRLLSTLSRDGQLYKVDLRLRPSGTMGDLLTSSGALRDYFQHGADIWEMQSFLKARPVAGDRTLARAVVAAVEAVIHDRSGGMGRAALAAGVRDMRSRLAAASRTSDRRPSIKLGEGGIADIHFTIEFLQLCHGVRSPEDKDTLRLLTHLNRLGHLDEQGMQRFYEGYLFLRSLDHEMRLIHDQRLEYLPADAGRQAELALALWSGDTAGESPATDLMDSFRTHAGAVRRTYDRIVSAG